MGVLCSVRKGTVCGSPSRRRCELLLMPTGLLTAPASETNQTQQWGVQSIKLVQTLLFPYDLHTTTIQ